MAVSVLAPVNRVTDANGLPYVNAYQYVYNAGTTTLRAIYTDDGLTTPADNPQRSNANGEFPRVFTAPGTYKLRRETSANVLIGSEIDDIDTGLSGDTVALPIAQGGTGATTAAAARSNLDVPSNSELDDLSSQVAGFVSSLTNIVSVPQGRLTLTSGVPVLATGVTAGAAVYYTPYIGNLCPIYDGSQFNPETFAELTLTLNSSYTLSSHYDVFIIKDGSTVRVVTGPAWSTITAGAGARGTGAGTTELTRLNGILVNANAMATARNGGSTYSVAANQGTYVGSIYIDGSAGQITCHTAYGQSRKWGVWNYYNRKRVILKAGDATANWNYTTFTFRASRNDATNCIDIFTGVAEEQFMLRFAQDFSNTNIGVGASIGIGYNSTTTTSGRIGLNVNAGTGNVYSIPHAEYDAPPALGYNRITSLERSNGTGTTTWYGTEAQMLLTATYEA